MELLLESRKMRIFELCLSDHFWAMFRLPNGNTVKVSIELSVIWTLNAFLMKRNFWKHEEPSKVLSPKTKALQSLAERMKKPVHLNIHTFSQSTIRVVWETKRFAIVSLFLFLLLFYFVLTVFIRTDLAAYVLYSHIRIDCVCVFVCMFVWVRLCVGVLFWFIISMCMFDLSLYKWHYVSVSVWRHFWRYMRVWAWMLLWYTQTHARTQIHWLHTLLLVRASIRCKYVRSPAIICVCSYVVLIFVLTIDKWSWTKNKPNKGGFAIFMW